MKFSQKTARKSFSVPRIQMKKFSWENMGDIHKEQEDISNAHYMYGGGGGGGGIQGGNGIRWW